MSRYTVAGVSVNKGKVKVRFCSDLVLRVKNLQKQGDTDINLIELSHAMTKVDACKYLLSNPAFGQYKTEIEEILGKKAKLVPQPKVTIQKTEVDSDLEEIKELAAA